MTEKALKRIQELLPKGELLEKAYMSFEGDYRIVSVDKDGNENRYIVVFNPLNFEVDILKQI